MKKQKTIKYQVMPLSQPAINWIYLLAKAWHDQYGFFTDDDDAYFYWIQTLKCLKHS